MGVTKHYSVLIKGRRLGPYTLDQIKAMRARGDCDSLTRIATVDHPDAWHMLDGYLQELDARMREPEPLEPPPITGKGVTELTSPASVIRPFPVFPLLLLHFLTFGIFSFFWALSRHGVLPKFRADDPSLGKAIALCFVPFYNLYWIVFVFNRLSSRTNEFAVSLQAPRRIPQHLAVVMALLYVIWMGLGMIGLVVWAIIMNSPEPPLEELSFIFFQIPLVFLIMNFFLAMPVFLAQMQIVLNSCFETQLSLLTRRQ